MDKGKKKVCSFYDWEWSKASDAMMILLNVSNLDPVIAANISEINKCIFKIETSGNVNGDKSVQIDESKLNRITTDEFHTLLDQVAAPQTPGKDKEDNKDEERADVDTEEMKKRIGDLFCQSNRGWWPHKQVYSSGVTSRNDISDNGRYKIMFDGFYSIQTKLIETQLKETLIKYNKLCNDTNKYNINDTIKDVNYLYSKMNCWRKACAFLPTKHQHPHFEGEWPTNTKEISCKGAKDYVEMIEYFDLKNNNVLKTYCLLSGSLYNIWFKEQHYNGSEALGFGWVLYLNQKNTDKSLLDLSRMFLLNQLAYSCIFGKDSFISNDDDLRNIDNNKRENELLKQDKHQKTMKKVLFNDDLTKLDKLLEYCLQDIPDQKNWVKNYEMVPYNPYQKKNIHWHTGITFYIMNRMLFAMFHDLMCYKHSNGDNGSPLFPQLKEFFMFMYNFCVYIHCYPTDGVRDNELFLVKQYYQLKDTIYDVFSEYRNEIKIAHPINFNLFDGEGTLLHKATQFRMSSYVSLLLKDGADINVEMRRRNYFTPLKIATKSNNYEILSLFSHVKSNEKTVQESKEDSKQEEQEEKTKMNEKSLETRYDEFMNQLMAAKYFLIGLGCDIRSKNDIKGVLHKSLEHMEPSKGNRIDYKGYYSDDFYYSLKDLVGLQSNNNENLTLSMVEPDMIMRNIVLSVISLLSLKMVLSQDLLIICAVYCSEFCDKNNELPQQFFQALKNVTKKCLKSNKLDKPNKNSNLSENESGIDLKERNYQWFKYFLLKSTVWLVRDETEESNESILFNSALEVVNGELIKQQQFIWENVQQEQKENEKMFSQLTSFGTQEKSSQPMKTTQLRQDTIENGIKSSVTEYELMVSTLEAGLSGRAANIANTNSSSSAFNINFEYTTKVYLTECLRFSHLNNTNFQKHMLKYFSDLDVQCKYASAPVKLYDRCVVKSTSDYSESSFPQSACILDFLRFSVTFDSIEGMVKALNQFINDINENKIACLKPNGVLRIKNGFKDISTKWKSYKDAQYCDIKLNIIYYNNKGETMLVEGQFLLKFLLTAKKMGMLHCPNVFCVCLFSLCVLCFLFCC